MSLTNIINNSFNKFPNKEIKENLTEKELDALILENTNKLINIKTKYDEVKNNWKALREDMESLSMYDRINCGEDIKEQFQKAIDDLKMDYRDTKATLNTYKAQKNKLLLEDNVSEDPIIDESEEIIEHLQDIIDTSDIYEVFKYLYNKLVPKIGPANTVAGEIIRALMAIMNGALRNNQVFYDGEGKDKFGSAFYYLTSKGYTDILEDAIGLTGDDYLSIIEKAIDRVARDLIYNPELLKTQNIEDYTQFTSLGENLDNISKDAINNIQENTYIKNNIKDFNNMKFLKENNNEDGKLLKIDTLYRDAIDYGVDPESLDKILYSNGANPDAPTFDIGLNVDKAYEELSNFLKKKYQSEFDRDYDDNSIPYDSYNILGFNKLAYKLELERLNKEIANLKDKYSINENKKELSNMKFLKENFSTRKEMIDWIEDHWNTRENSDYLYQVLGDLGLDIEDDSDEDEGFYANLTNDNLKRVIDILKSDTKPTDKEQVNMIKNAIKSVGRVVDMKDDGYGSDLATFDVLMDPENTYRVQIYKM